MRSRISITKLPLRLCEVCGSSDTQFFISFTDRNNPVYSNFGGKSNMACNESVLSCPKCVEPATAILLRKAKLVQ